MMSIVMIGMLLVSGVSSAKVKTIETKRNFEQSLKKDSMVIVLFYEGAKQKGGAHAPQKKLIRMFEELSAHQSYDDADVIFLKVNTSRAELSSLALSYGITVMPAILFFNNGKCLIDDQGKKLLLTGFVSQEDISLFIEKYYGSEIQRRVAQKGRIKDEQVRKENESWKPYFYPRDIFMEGYDPSERQKNME